MTAFALAEARRGAADWKRRTRHIVGKQRDTDDVCAAFVFETAELDRAELWEYEEVLLGKLTRCQRAALELHVMDGLSDRQIAAMTGYAEASLAVQRLKAKRICKSLIKTGEFRLPPR